jgi:hypothetical protein
MGLKQSLYLPYIGSRVWDKLLICPLIGQRSNVASISRLLLAGVSRLLLKLKFIEVNPIDSLAAG